MRESLLAEGIPALQPPSMGNDTGFCITLVEPDAERTFVTMVGAEATLSAADLARITATPHDIVTVSGYDLAYPGSGAALATWLTEIGAATTVALDPGPLVLDIPTERLAAVLAVTDLLTLNQSEARAIARDHDLEGRELLAAVRRALAISQQTIIVVREGAAGCVADGGECGDAAVRVEAPETTPVDTTGAGDTHTGVLLAWLLGGRPLTAALHAANIAAAISVGSVGSATAPSRDTLERRIARANVTVLNVHHQK